MKLSKQILIGAITLILLVVTVIPAFAAVAEYALTVHNKTGGNVTLILRGPTDVDVEITRLTTVVKLEQGTYTYRYRACGLRNTGTFTIGSGGRNLTLKKCEKAPNGTLVIDNRTGTTFYLRMYGPQRYNLIIKPGDNVVTIAAGRYTYSAPVCGETRVGDKGIKSKNNPDWVWTCN